MEQGLVQALSQWSKPVPPAPERSVAPFSTMTTLLPRLAAAMAAKQPERPPPSTSTSLSTVSVWPNSFGKGQLQLSEGICYFSFPAALFDSAALKQQIIAMA